MRSMNLVRGRIPPHLVLLVLALTGLAVYVMLVLRFPIETYIGVPRSNVGSLTRRSTQMAMLLAVAGITLYSSYVASILLCWRSQRIEHMRPIIWGYGIAASAILILIWPITSTDIFDYIFRGRMASEYGANPYVVMPNRFSDDPLSNYVGWPNAPTAYGPLWELMSARMAAIGGASIWTNILLHKILAVLTFLTCGLVITRMARPLGARAELVGGALWLMSPLTLWEIPAVGHNDGFLILSILLALWATTHHRYRWATIALVVGALVKYLPAILLPLLAVHGLRHYHRTSERLRLLVEMALITIVLVGLAYIPYWEGAATLRNITVREKFLNAAPLSIITYTLSQWWEIDSVRPIVNRVGTTLLGLGILWQCLHIWFERRDLRTASFGLLTWYLVVASQWFQPWYILWLLALLAIQPRPATFAWITTWALSAQTSYLLQFFILNWLGVRGNELRGQLLYLLIIFTPLLIAWSLSRRQDPPPTPATKQSLAPS
jgi:hypothetical protein